MIRDSGLLCSHSVCWVLYTLIQLYEFVYGDFLDANNTSNRLEINFLNATGVYR